MRAVVTGGLGFIGRELARRLIELGADVAIFDAAQGDDICDGQALRRLIRPGDTVFHLAAIRGGMSEQNFDLAWRVNLDGSRTVLEACRSRGETRFVFASTVAVFGPDDVERPAPQTTYGATKAAVEVLLNDYRRKGFVDARAGRLATVIVRPDAPAQAASGFASAVFREPLAGRNYEVPVSLERRLPVIGIRTAVECFVRLAGPAADTLGADGVLTFPSLSVTVEELVEASRRAGATGRIGARSDPEVEAIVGTWPGDAPAARALALGLPQDESVDTIVRDYLAALGAVPAVGTAGTNG